MTPDELSALRKELQTQDNACTEHPLFCVFQKQRIYGLDFDHAEHFAWLTPDHVEHFAWLTPDDGDGRRETDENTPGAERVGYIDVDRFVTACLTRKSAKDFIERNSHRLRKPFVYVDTLYGNDEMIALRNHLMTEPPCST